MKAATQSLSDPMRTTLGMGLALLCGALVAASVFFFIRHFQSNGLEPLLPLGQRPAGALSLPLFRTADARAPAPPEMWSLDSQRGHVVIVNYFATWCPPCVAELPMLQKLAADYAPRGVVTVAVAIDRDSDFQNQPRDPIVRTFAQAHAMSIPILQPPADASMSKEPTRVPQTFVYDKSGHRAGWIMGEADEPTLRAWLDALLKE